MTSNFSCVHISTRTRHWQKAFVSAALVSLIFHIRHDLSITIAGNEHLSAVLCLLCVYGLVKYKDTMLRAIMYSRNLFIAVRNGEWGTDNHLFAMSLVLNRPIFLFNTFYFADSDTNEVTLSLSGATDISSLIHPWCTYHWVGLLLQEACVIIDSYSMYKTIERVIMCAWSCA